MLGLSLTEFIYREIVYLICSKRALDFPPRYIDIKRDTEDQVPAPAWQCGRAPPGTFPKLP